MASAESIALRREAAKGRIETAIGRIVTDTGADVEPRPEKTRYPEMDMAVHDEWLAGALERIAAAVETPPVSA